MGTFAYDWARGFVSPFLAKDGETAFTTPQHVIEALLDILIGRGTTFVVDMGSGDGRIVHAAARRGLRSHGIELDAELVASSRRQADDACLTPAGLCTFEHSSLLEAPLPSGTSDILAYLLPPALVKLARRLCDLQWRGRLFAIRWTVDCEVVPHVRLRQRHDLASGWVVNEYEVGYELSGHNVAAAGAAAPAWTLAPAAAARVVEISDALTSEVIDAGEDWQALPCDIFGDPSIVPVGCELFELPLPPACECSSGDVEDGANGAGGEGGDAATSRPPLVIRVRPKRAAFERRDASPPIVHTHGDGKEGGGGGVGAVGAEVGRMTGALLWDSAVVLASYLAASRAELQCGSLRSPLARVCELGAGLGLAGLTAAACLGRATILTDREEVLYPSRPPTPTRGPPARTCQADHAGAVVPAGASAPPRGCEGQWATCEVALLDFGPRMGQHARGGGPRHVRSVARL